MDNVNVLKPIFLFADSQLLFSKNKERLFLESIKEYVLEGLEVCGVKAAYIGASNDDNPQFYEIFKAAMQQVEITNCRLIKSEPDTEDINFLKNADIILLAGGNTKKGWDVIKRNEWDKIITERYVQGCILIGVSAGAIQLGSKGYTESGEKQSGFSTLQLVPYLIDVHADNDWLNLSKRVELEGGQLKGYGIPYGAGIICYPDMSIEALRFSCTEIVHDGNEIKKSIILPPDREKK